MITPVSSCGIPRKKYAFAKSNPAVKLFGPAQVCEDYGEGMIAVAGGDKQAVGPFTLDFFGNDHELYAGFNNTAVLVNGAVYHPGDSYTKPGVPVKLLGLPDL